MKILLAVDGSKHSLAAVQSLVAHADWYRDKPDVELVTVHLPVPRLAGISKFVSKAQIRDYYQEEGEARLGAARKLLERAGIACQARVLVGPVAETIVAHARERRCDMIFIGTRGMGAAGNMLLGATATKVLHLARVPVLVAK
ncbi:MAG: universal stress protein [Burkholderiales bacterium]|jgi:nucleotide-binding universal stress UspA family protein